MQLQASTVDASLLYTCAGKSALSCPSKLPDEHFGALVAKRLDALAAELRPNICLRLEAARNAALARRRQD